MNPTTTGIGPPGQALPGRFRPLTAAFDVPDEPGGVHEFDITLQTGDDVVGMRVVLVSGLD